MEMCHFWVLTLATVTLTLHFCHHSL